MRIYFWKIWLWHLIWLSQLWREPWKFHKDRFMALKNNSNVVSSGTAYSLTLVLSSGKRHSGIGRRNTRRGRTKIIRERHGTLLSYWGHSTEDIPMQAITQRSFFLLKLPQCITFEATLCMSSFDKSEGCVIAQVSKRYDSLLKVYGSQLLILDYHVWNNEREKQNIIKFAM